TPPSSTPPTSSWTAGSRGRTSPPCRAPRYSARMSMTPPPGWYRDPHAPHLERWWDGTAWTEHRRPPEAPAAPPAPSTGGTGGPAAGGGRRKAVAWTAAGAVLVAAVVTGAVFLRGDDGDTRPRTGPGATSPAATGPRSPSPSPPASASEPAGDP